MPFAKSNGTVFLVGFLFCAASGAQPTAAKRTVSLDVPVQVSLAGTEPQFWQFRAEAGEYLHLAIRPGAVPLRASLLGPTGSEIAVLLNESGDERPLLLSFIAAEAGMFRLVFSLNDPSAPARQFQFLLLEQRLAQPGDATRAKAERLFESARILQLAGGKESLQQAIGKFEDALPFWREIGDKASEGHTLAAITDAYLALGNNPKASETALQGLPLARAAADVQDEADLLINLGVAVSFRDPKKALEYLNSALPLARSAGDRNLECTALSNIGSVYLLMGDPRRSVDFATRALAIKRDLGDRHGEMQVLTNVGVLYYQLGETHKALEAFRELLPLRQQAQDRRGEGATLYYIGTCLARLGDFDQALESLNQALPIIREAGDRRSESRALTNLGTLYLDSGQPQQALRTMQEVLPLARELKDRHQEESILIATARAYFRLGDADQALDYCRQALAILREVADKFGEGLALDELGSIYAWLGEAQKAKDAYQQALAVLAGAGNQTGQAVTHHDLGNLFLKQGDTQAALLEYQRALALSAATGDRHTRAVIEVDLGAAYRVLGDQQKARDSLNDAFAGLSTMGDRLQQSRALYYLARLDSDSTDWEHARRRLQDALRIDEQVRGAMAGPELRSSYFTTVLDQYDLLVDVLMHLHQRNPSAGYDQQAFATAERGRARSLLDLLSQAQAGIREGVDPALLARERSLTARLHSRTERQIELLAKGDAPGAASVEQEIRTSTAQYHELEAKILAASPRYAAFAQPGILTVRQLQHELDDPAALLLEYALGSERSFLFAITNTSFRTFELPKRSEIDALARRCYDGLAATDPAVARTAVQALRRLSGMILGPVAGELGRKRLVIVTAGALQYVPFAALPAPGHPGEPLVVRHEIVSLPSASTLAFLRRERPSRMPSKLLAVLADPVFSANDPRVNASDGALPGSVQRATGLRAIAGFERPNLERLTFTRKEALDILALAPPNARFSALGFDASRATATGGALAGYRFVHIASHGLVNTLHPELSSIVLSLVDRSGHPQNGLLEATDIYNLKLDSELVVLSACQTALGREVRGEGLVGLTRAFMYAGVPSVIASLWTVSDQSTAELMTRLYQGILLRKLRPAAALRDAQVALWKERRWTRPYYWAAFTLQGEWR